MRKLLVLVLLVGLGLTLNAQKYIYDFPTDTVSSNETTYYPSSLGLDASKSSTGSIVFTFTHTDIVDSLNYARFEWVDHTSGTWTAMTSPAALVNTTTNGQSVVYISTPILHKKYRVALHCATGDSVKITIPTLMYKNE